MVTALVLGVAWFTVGALGKAAPTAAQREIETGRALQAAKRALLGYIAQYAARTDHDVPGRLPCPELLGSIGGASEGQAPGACSNTAIEVGRLPWRTLGVDRILDGSGEPLWYVLSPGFRQSPINFDSIGQLTLDGAVNAAVALIIAPGPPLETLSDPGVPPAGCQKRNQGGARFTNPLDPLDFLECGHGDTVSNNYVTSESTKWRNDRVLAVTAAEVMDAIAGPVADRIQRQVMPALNDWRTTESAANWGVSFLPYASTFSNPATNGLCGANGVTEGMPPIPDAASTDCNTAWTNGTASLVLGLISLGCAQMGTEMRCWFLNLLAVPPFSARISARAPNVAGSFRAPIAQASIQNNGGGVVVPGSFSLALSAATGDANLQFDISFVAPPFFTTVRFPNLPDAAVINPSAVVNPRMSWFLSNNWARHVYYAVAPAAVVNPGVDLLAATGLDPTTGNPNDKRVALVLMGRRLSGQPATCAVVGDCLEGDNATTGDRSFASAAASSAFNDRIAACPFQFTPQTGGPVTVCN